MLAIQGKAASEVSQYTVVLPEGSVHGHAEQVCVLDGQANQNKCTARRFLL
jgi:hypothetical protein